MIATAEEILELVTLLFTALRGGTPKTALESAIKREMVAASDAVMHSELDRQG